MNVIAGCLSPAMLLHGSRFHYRQANAVHNEIEFVNKALKVIAVDQADRIQAFVLVGKLGVRHVIEADRQGMQLVEAIAQFGGEIEQDARSQFLAIQKRGLQLARMGGAAGGEGHERLAPQVPIPVAAEKQSVGFLGGVEDRNSVVQGKRVDLGGRRIIKKNTSCSDLG